MTKRPIFEFVSSTIRPSDALVVFPLADDYSFGILQSTIHWSWFKARCSTLKEDYRYTSNTVFDSFPWPQSPNIRKVRAVAKVAKELRELRSRVMQHNDWSLRELYRTLDEPGINQLRNAHDALDKAVRQAYGMGPKDEILEFLLALNLKLFKAESEGKGIIGPGLPPNVKDPSSFLSNDCVSLET